MIESGIIVPSCPGTSTSSDTSWSKPGYTTSELKILFANVSFSASMSYTITGAVHAVIYTRQRSVLKSGQLQLTVPDAGNLISSVLPLAKSYLTNRPTTPFEYSTIK